jgi:hypothetical protein
VWTLDVDVVSLAWLDSDSRAGCQLLPIQLHLMWSDEDLVMKEVKQYGMLALGSCPRSFLAAALDVCAGCRMLPS